MPFYTDVGNIICEAQGVPRGTERNSDATSFGNKRSASRNWLALSAPPDFLGQAGYLKCMGLLILFMCLEAQSYVPLFGQKMQRRWHPGVIMHAMLATGPNEMSSLRKILRGARRVARGAIRSLRLFTLQDVRNWSMSALSF